MKKININLRKLIFSFLSGIFLGVGFIFFFIPIRNAPVSILLIITVFIATTLLIGFNAKLQNTYERLTKWNKVLFLFFIPTFSLLLLISIKGEQIYLQDNHFFTIMYVYISTYLTLNLFVLSIIYLLLKLNFHKVNGEVPKYRVILYSLPSIAVFSMYLLGYYPGLMTFDSLYQWVQIHTNQYHDWHPVVHTWFLKLITLVWDYPAAIAITQIIIMSLTFGYGMYCFEKYGIKRWILYLITFAFSLMPLNGIYSVTLWKDVLYSTSIMLLTILLFNIVISKGEWLRRPTSLLLFFLASTEFVFFRHNGFPAFVVTMLIFFIIYRLKLSRMYVIALVVIALHFIVTGPIFKHYNVIPSDPNEAYAVPIQQIGRIIAYDGKVSEEQLNFFDKVLPLEEWQTNYNPYIADPLKGSPNYNRDFLYANRNIFFKYWLEICLQNPKLAISAYSDLASLVWQIRTPDGYLFVYAGDPPTPETLKEYNIKPVYGNQDVKVLLSKILETSRNLFGPLFRPATYLFATVLLLFITILKKHWRISLIALPVLLNTAIVAVSLPAQDVRYLYANFLSVIILFLATIVLKEPKKE